MESGSSPILKNRNYKQALAHCLSSPTQRQLQFYFLSNCNCSPLIVEHIEFLVFLAIVGSKYRTMYMSSKCLLRRTGREELNRFASLISGPGSVFRLRQSPDLFPLFSSIFGSLAIPLYSISHYDPLRMHLL